MTSLTPKALTFEDVLRAVCSPRSGSHMPTARIVELTGRNASNIHRDLAALVSEGLLEGDKTIGWRITQAGMDARNAIDRANGKGRPVAGLPLWPLDQIEFNPDNPRKGVAQEPLEGLADTIAEAEGLLQPIVLYPVGTNGARMLHAGERRVRACRLLQGEGRLPAALQAGLPFIERAATKAEALFIGLVENSQRENLTPYEDALGLKAYQDETGLSARAIAFKLGRAREGSEEGVRDVQEKIKTLTRAKPEAIARVEAGRESFDWLRQQVRKRLEDVGQQLRPIDILTLAEVKLQARLKPKRFSYGERQTECSYTAGKDPVLKGLVSQGLLSFTEQAYDDHKAWIEVSYTATAVFNTEELAGIHGDLKAAAALVHSLQVAALGQAKADQLAKSGLYATQWLNGPFVLSDKAQTKVDAAKVTKSELRAANKIKTDAHNLRFQEVMTLVVQAEERGLSMGMVDKINAQMARSKVVFPLRVAGKSIVDAGGHPLIWQGLGYQFAADQDVLLPLLCTVLNSVLAPTPLEAAIAKTEKGEDHAAA